MKFEGLVVESLEESQLLSDIIPMVLVIHFSNKVILLFEIQL